MFLFLTKRQCELTSLIISWQNDRNKRGFTGDSGPMRVWSLGEGSGSTKVGAEKNENYDKFLNDSFWKTIGELFRMVNYKCAATVYFCMYFYLVIAKCQHLFIY